MLGVLAISSEYSSGMIRTSLIAVPKRGRVLAAKSLVFAGVTLVVGEVTTFVAFFAGQALISGHAPHAALGASPYPGPRTPLQAVTSEPFLILAVTGPPRSGDVAACRHRG